MKTFYQKIRAIILIAVMSLGLPMTIFGQATGTLFEDFEKGTTQASYTETTHDNYTSGSWKIAAVVNPDANDRYIGARSARLRVNASPSYIMMNFDKTDGAGNISFKYGAYGTHTVGKIKVEYSTNQGVTWTQLGEIIDVPAWGGNMLDASIDVNVAGNIRFRISQGQTTGNGSFNIDNITVTPYSVATNTSKITWINPLGVTISVKDAGLPITESSRSLPASPGGNELTNGSSVENGTVVNITATTEEGCTLNDILVNGTSLTSSNYTVNEDILITVTATWETFTITLPENPIGYSVVAEDGYSSPVNYGSNYVFKVNLDAAYSNSNITVKANTSELTPADGIYTINNITTNYTITVDGVAKNAYQITVTQAENGTISPETTSVEHGDDITFTITPDPSFIIEYLVIDGTNSIAASSYTFNNVTAVHTISAKFVQEPSIEVTTFTGNGSWNDPSNWNTGTVPDVNSDVTIAGVLTIASEDIINCGVMTITTGSVELQSGATLTATSLVNTDPTKLIINNQDAPSTLLVANGDFEATVKQNITNDWQLIATPNKNVINASDCFVGFLIHQYAEATNKWDLLTGVSPINSFTGYSLGKTTTNQFTFSGTINNSTNHVYTLTKTAGDNNGWNLLGNSWLGAIDLSKTSLTGSFYIYSNGNYLPYAMGLRNGTFDGRIPALQGFFVQAESDQQTLDISRTSLVSNKPLYKSNIDLPMIKINVKGNKYEDNVLITQLSNCNADFNYGFDARKINGNANAPQMYVMMNDNTKLSISASDDLNYTHIGFNKGIDSNYTLNWTIDNIDHQLWLYDAKTSKNINMNEQSSYQFTSATTDSADRFIIALTPVGVCDIDVLDANIFSYGKTITIVSKETEVRVEVIDIEGRIVNSHVMNSSQSTVNIEQTGVYVVRVIGNNSVKTSKVIIR